MRCDYCTDVAHSQCRECGKFICPRHGAICCLDCAGIEEPWGKHSRREQIMASQSPPMEVVLAGQTVKVQRVFVPSNCVVCHGPAERPCVRCGEYYCREHGLKLVSIPPFLSRRWLCRSCHRRLRRPQWWAWGLRLLMAAGLLIVMIFLLARSLERVWE
ncbi:MAG: hypothetical protein ACK4RK_02415 [Gemmataceae bacterium]